jgi:hypothetical protein
MFAGAQSRRPRPDQQNCFIDAEGKITGIGVESIAGD